MLRRPAASAVGRDTIVPNSQDCKLNSLPRFSSRAARWAQVVDSRVMQMELANRCRRPIRR